MRRRAATTTHPSCQSPAHPARCRATSAPQSAPTWPDVPSVSRGPLPSALVLSIYPSAHSSICPPVHPSLPHPTPSSPMAPRCASCRRFFFPRQRRAPARLHTWEPNSPRAWAWIPARRTHGAVNGARPAKIVAALPPIPAAPAIPAVPSSRRPDHSPAHGTTPQQTPHPPFQRTLRTLRTQCTTSRVRQLHLSPPNSSSPSTRRPATRDPRLDNDQTSKPSERNY
jgi:hypothetical protein